ncbi:hypothetical protein KZ483_01715 [Paenibacillus sp. sptzw28]|uniref:hypothetical protein n=1 Tax=Paenibacillus sp. sptzw28 TaxID=715179 RepID=UPI001C6DEC35|nr:hypothetical protein [Paenibacillus sp. sptzw28]QYR21786.1 hypothetical protein KZ483_01715 [Paenibacillus sp. sptzw28]
MKKIKQPGDNISLKTKKNENPAIMQWINAQTNLMDSLRYLIENELHQHGVRNLQSCIPAERTLLVPGSPAHNTEAMTSPAAAASLEAAAAGKLEEANEPEQPVEDDIDDDDIDSWT